MPLYHLFCAIWASSCFDACACPCSCLPVLPPSAPPVGRGLWGVLRITRCALADLARASLGMGPAYVPIVAPLPPLSGDAPPAGAEAAPPPPPVALMTLSPEELELCVASLMPVV